MVFKKLSKKIMAYTLTTAMMTGFFAVSNINLTTAWAATELSAGALIIDSTDVTLSGDVTVDGAATTGNLTNGNLTGDIASVSLNGATGKLVVPSGKKITITHASNALTNKFILTNSTKKIDTASNKSVIINGPAEITKDGITFKPGGNIVSNDAGNVITGATITGGLVDGGTLTGATVNGATLKGSISLGTEDAANGGEVILNNCKSDTTAVTLTINKAAAGKTNKVSVKGTYVADGSAATTLAKATSGSETGASLFSFDNATVSGKFIACTTASSQPTMKGTIKASGLNLSGKVVESDAVITFKDGINVIDATTAENGFNNLTLVRGADFSGASCKATILSSSASSKSVELLKTSSTDEDNFADGMVKGNIVVTGQSGEDDAHGYGAHIQDGYLTYGLYDFDYAKSGRNVDVTCVAKGNKHDGTKFQVTVKPNVAVGIGQIGTATSSENGDGFDDGTLVDYSKVPASLKVNGNGVWEAFKLSCRSIANKWDDSANSGSGASAALGVTDTYTVKFLKEVSAKLDTADTTMTGSIVKKDISKAVVNGLADYDIDTFTLGTTGVGTRLPDGFVSVELGGDASHRGNRTAFEAGTLSSSNVYVVYKTEDGKLQGAAIGTSTETPEFAATAGKHTINLVGKGNYTGTFTLPYEIVDHIVESVDYNGNARTASVSGAQSYSVNGGTWTTDAPTFTDAGTYSFNYKLSDGVAKTATFTINPATVTPVWNINSTGNAIEYDYDGKAKTRTVVNVSGSLTQSVLDKFDTSAITYKYYYGNDATKAEVKECVDATDADKYYYVAPIADIKVNKNFKFSTTSNAYGKITINKVDAEVTSKKEVVAYYDGAAHSVDSVTVNAPEGSYKVLYGTSASTCTSATVPTYKEEGTYIVYYEVSSAANYDATTNGKVNVTFANTKGTLKLTIKPALTMKRSDSTKETVTYTGKYYPITADAYSGDSKESDVKVVIYARKDNGKFAKVTDGIKDVGLYTFKYAFVIDGKEGSQVPMDDTVTIKAAPKKSIAKATASAKAVTYNANKQTAKVTVKYGNTTLKLNKDYTLKNATHINAGSFKVTITGKGNYTGTKTVTFKIAKRKVTKGVVTVKRNKKTFTVYVKIGKKNYKVAKTNYKLTAKYNKKTKKYAVTVAFKVNYSGTVKKTVK